MTKKQNSKTILELKKKLSEIPDTDFFSEKREKLEIKITSAEIMSTPAACDFLNDLLETNKKLLLPKSPARWGEILVREQFYRNWGLPTEINNLIEEEAWNLTQSLFGKEALIPLIFESFVFSVKNVFIFTGGGYEISFTEPVQITAGWVIGMNFYLGVSSEIQRLLLEQTEEGDKLELLSVFAPDSKIGLRVDKETNFFTLDFYPVIFDEFPEGVKHPFMFLKYQGEPWKSQQELVKEIFWLLRLLRNDISLAETAPKGLRAVQEFLQNHFQREFVKLHRDNPQLLARVRDLPWFKFTALQANIPQKIQEDQTIETPSIKPEEPEETLEQLEEVKNQILTRLNVQVEKAKNKPIYSLPLNFVNSQEKTEFQPPKICKILDCQTPIPSSKEYCHFHKWETGFDQRLNAERTNLFPDLAKTTPAESQAEQQLGSLQEQLAQQSQDYCREIELAKFHEERGKINCACWQCEIQQGIRQEIKREQKKSRKKAEPEERLHCEECNKLVAELEEVSGVCKKCEEKLE